MVIITYHREGPGQVRIRYKLTKSGKRIPIAKIYTIEEHGIGRNAIDRDALKITNRLQDSGHEAYVVGGAVRDLLTGRSPKDFDIATDASPNRIRKLFRNSRIIGRRFRLAHIFFREKIIEVSTFRSFSGGNNEYGTIEEDASRRDFSLNALYYDPREQAILDYVDGFKDIESRRVRSLLPLDSTFKEDPVRMIRALKYAVITGFNVERRLKKEIRKQAHEIGECSTSRLTEEVFKILQSGVSVGILRSLHDYGLLERILPKIVEEGKSESATLAPLITSLSRLDGNQRVEDGKGDSIAGLVRPYVRVDTDVQYEELTHQVFSRIKELWKPLTPPNRDVEAAVSILLAEHGIHKPQRKNRKRKKRTRKPPRHRSSKKRNQEDPNTG